MSAPNRSQQALIEGIDGCYLVDAGPGTGKTFTITHRYANILAHPGVEPDDILLITFTRNAAAEMRERIVRHADHRARDLVDAPIQTFHSLCHDILREGGFDAPGHLGVDETITTSTQVVEDDLAERERFRSFMAQFADRRPEHDEYLAIVDDPTDLLHLVRKLAAKGIVPTSDGWYRGCEAYLHGDRETFEASFDERNRQPPGTNKQSPLRKDLNGYGDRCYTTDAPTITKIRGDDAKTVPASVKALVFEKDRTDLIGFVHDVYLDYLRFALARNYLNFGFLQVLALVHLCEHDRLRERLAFEYVMIDEFQDTSEIQFKLALLLCGTENLCVVGDWKQSIYSFQYASVENITDFEDRLARYVDELNDDRSRVGATFDPIQRIDLERNYRSTQAIIDRAARGLEVRGSTREHVDVEAVRARVVDLEGETAHEHSHIEAIQHPDEPAAILAKIGEIVGNDAYAVRDDDELRPPRYGDIAVVTRTRRFGRDLLALGEANGFPMAYEGAVELFRTDAAKFVLAWLRILEDGSDADRGWAMVLEHAGYRRDEIDAMVTTGSYPPSMLAFRRELAELSSVGAIARRICERYGETGSAAAQLPATLEAVYGAATMTRGALIRYLARAIETGATREVTAPAGEDAVKVKTIHATKGLEYPIVLLANVNSRQFPASGRDVGAIVYEEGMGLRQRKVYADDHGHPHVYTNWRWDVLKACRPKHYDEERRLLYVAMTRARDHVIFSAGETPSTFLEDFPVEVESYQPDIVPPERPAPDAVGMTVEVPPPKGPRGVSPHDLMETAVFDEVEAGRGPTYGVEVHEFAEAYARGESVVADDADKRHVQAYIDALEGEVFVEQDAYLPLTVDGEQVSIHGFVDLVHVTADVIDLIDWKTDLEPVGEEEYRKQLSIYYHVLNGVFPDRDVTASIVYTTDGRRVDIDPISKAELAGLVRLE